jgi:hypothetical protein
MKIYRFVILRSQCSSGDEESQFFRGDSSLAKNASSHRPGIPVRVESPAGRNGLRESDKKGVCTYGNTR